MKTLRIIYQFSKRYPQIPFVAAPLLTLSSFIAAGSIVGLAPIVDLLIRSESRPPSQVTLTITQWMQSVGLPVSVFSMMVLFLALVVLKNVVTAFSRYVTERLHFKIMEKTIIEIFQGFLSAKWHFFVASNFGVLGNTVLRQTEKIGLAFDNVVRILSHLLRAFAFIGVAFFLSWKLVGLAIALIGFVLVPFLLLGKRTYRLGVAHTRASNAFQGIVTETLGGAKLILGFGNQHKSSQKLKKHLTPYLSTALQFTMIRAIAPLTFEPISFVTAFAILYVGTFFYHIELPVLLIVIYALKSGAELLYQVTSEQNHLQNVAPALEQIDRLIADTKRMAHPSGARTFDKLKGDIVFEKVFFAYPAHGDTLKDMTLLIPKGKMTAIVGRSGSGKTTLIDLLMGFYEPDDGQLLVNGVGLKEFDIISWRQRIGFVPQDPYLFDTTIRENLLWANENASPEELSEVCEQANANEFIDQLPKHLDTIIGDRGIRLSTGQRQRIALARALLRRPDILILDEATSALDSHSELLIQQSVERISSNVTVVVVAHRLSTIREADCIYVLEQGRVVESGRFNELVKIEGGEFSKTAQLQGLD